MVQSAYEYAEFPDEVECVAVLDLDEPRKLDYLRQPYKLAMDFTGADPDTNMSDLWNLAWANAQGDIFMLAADDMVFESECWDSIVRDAFPSDGIAFVYGDTCTRQDAFGELGFIRREWTDAVGRFTPPYFTHDYCDTWLNDVAKDIGRHRYVPIVTRHLRAAYGLAPQDETSAGIAERTGEAMPRLYNVKATERAEEAAKLRAVMR
jgi:hypothetical protein